MANPLIPNSNNSNNSINGVGNVLQIISKFKEFKDNFNGNPEEVLNNMISSGKYSKEEVEGAVDIANQIYSFISKK